MRSSILVPARYRSTAALGVVMAPTLLLLVLVAAYAVVPLACESGRPAYVHLVMAGGLGIEVILAGVAWHGYRRGRATGEPVFLHHVSLGTIALASLTLLAMWLTALVLRVCG